MENNVQVFRPQSLDELDVQLRQNETSWVFVAGGTDLLVQKERWLNATRIIDLTAVPALHQTIETGQSGVRIGAAVPYGEIIRHSVLQKRLPLLTEACRHIGAVQIQNRGTIGGNIANASPAGDTLPVLAVLNAELLIGPRENNSFRRVPVNEMMLGPGQTLLQKNEYIAFIEIPWLPDDGYLWAFRKVGQREALAISKLSLAVLLRKKGNTVHDVRIASGSVAPVIKRHEKTEQTLLGKELTEARIEQAAETLKTEINPISDVRSTREYRKQVTADVLKDILYGWL